jgi:succinate dehydrogenase/fumarate reductase flavoprotein subunit
MDIFHFDVVAIGRGVSGMMAAISAIRRWMNV